MDQSAAAAAASSSSSDNRNYCRSGSKDDSRQVVAGVRTGRTTPVRVSSSSSSSSLSLSSSSSTPAPTSASLIHPKKKKKKSPYFPPQQAGTQSPPGSAGHLQQQQQLQEQQQNFVLGCIPTTTTRLSLSRLVWIVATTSIFFLFLQQSHVAKLSVDAVFENDAADALLLTNRLLQQGTLVANKTKAAAARDNDNDNDNDGAPPQLQNKSHLHQHQRHHHIVWHLADQIARGNTSMLPLKKKIPVVVWPLWEFGATTAEAQHIEKNGIEESPLLELSDDYFNMDPHVVWIGDTGYAYGWKAWCDKFNEYIQAAQARRTELGLSTSWPIFIVDWTDSPTKQRCPQVEKSVGGEFVSYSQRSLVFKRRWNDDKNWVDEGYLTPTKDGIQYRHTPLVVRTDIIENLQKVLIERGLKLKDDIEALDRPVDVTHLWPLNPTGKMGDVASKLRTRVSDIVFDIANKTNNNLKVYVDRAGNVASQGRRGVASAYLDAMLSTKILVVTQRDAWEDHYRLFEALISGALVMADRMVSLPADLQNGTSIIEFSSEEQLRTLIDYYLKNPKERMAIAREGRRISMMRHRTWHRIEEVIFGRPITTCSNHPTTDCPYIVHANETSR